MSRPCSYLRIVVTSRCPLACSYCHREGEPRAQAVRELPRETLERCLAAAVRAGARKLKLLGGEPFLREDLPEIIRYLRSLSPEADISAISSGAVPADRLERAFAAGLSRVNVTVHGFSALALAERTRVPKAHATRLRFIEAALGHGRPMKLNYVYRSSKDDPDLAGLLDWAAGLPSVTVAVLDDLNDPAASWEVPARAIERIRGKPESTHRFDDPDSLPTLHWRYGDGLAVELKDYAIGASAPFRACERCPIRRNCREGIHAMRLSSDGSLQPCLGRRDLGLRLAEIACSHGSERAAAELSRHMEAL